MQFTWTKNKRIYLFLLSLTALLGYGFLVTHGTVGIDDTPYKYYFEEGLNVVVGRWVLFLVNKVFSIANFAPFFTDLAGVLILMLAACVWTTLFYRISGRKIPMWAYCFSACIFISSPLLSEVYTYYLHNGVSLGYLFVGLSLIGLDKSFDVTKTQKHRIAMFFMAVLSLFIAAGCYESFVVVWLVGFLLVLLTKRYVGVSCKVFKSLLAAAGVVVLAILLRTIMIPLTTLAFGLQELQGEAIQRSLGEMLGWMFESDAWAEFAMAVKRIYVMYFVFGYAYYPIRVFVYAGVVLTLAGICYAIYKKDAWILVLTIGTFIASFLLVLIEGSATLYRSAQFLPLICGYGALLLGFVIRDLTGEHGKGKIAGKTIPWYRLCRGISVALLSIILWNQCADLNKWFYMDWMKYEAAKETAGRVYYELQNEFDVSKPVVFTGVANPPKEIINDAYVTLYSETYYKIKRLTDLVDENLIYKFYREYGVWVAQTPALSVLDWGINAFEGGEEMQKFFRMHGYDYVVNRDREVFAEASQTSLDWPKFPAEGSIRDMGEYIIVHF